MVERIQAIRGMNDILPEQSYAWRNLESIFAQCLQSYGYQEIRLPLLESTQLFKRTIGEVTDIVEKEMYTFNDLNEESISLRPEGTAGCVRACLEHGLLHNQQQKLWYTGPMFRHEKPQKGRYRQFNQFGVEAFGIPGVGIELELILICKRLWATLGVADSVHLEINTLGELSERQAYRQLLIDYFKSHNSMLDEDSKRRLDRSPMRILDSKNPDMKSLIQNAPKLIDVLSETSRNHFNELCAGLDALGVAYRVNPVLVRGLDYYGHTVFEWVTEHLGSQATVCAGGRFDKLIEQLGGNSSPAVGFALGVERLLLLQESVGVNSQQEPASDVFIITDGFNALQRALVLAESLRNACDLNVTVNTSDARFKSQFKRADKSGARLALILGEDELTQQIIGVKDLRQTVEQKNINQSDLNEYLKSFFAGEEHVCLHDRS
ncbi:MAG: histidine--tRNA ligase [Legionellaceae bacterium]|nr:histidine--tRNA ligase [Legionellaceae bacterium]